MEQGFMMASAIMLIIGITTTIQEGNAAPSFATSVAFAALAVVSRLLDLA